MAGPLGIALCDDLGRRMAPELRDAGYARHVDMLLQNGNRLKAKPCVNDDCGSFGRFLDYRENRLVTCPSQCAVEGPVNTFNEFQERRLDRVQGENRPTCSFGQAMRQGSFCRKPGPRSPSINVFLWLRYGRPVEGRGRKRQDPTQ